MFPRADFAAEIVAAAAGQHDIEQHEIGADLFEKRERLPAIAALAYLVAFAAQRIAEAESDVGVVFDDEEMFLHIGISDFRFQMEERLRRSI
jgi:hypothetical protein